MVEATVSHHLPSKKLVNISKLMSQILRHGAESRGILMRQDGFIYLADLLNDRGMQ